MPYAYLSLQVTVPAEFLPRAREILESALDEVVRQEIPTFDIQVEEGCADPPDENDDPPVNRKKDP